MNACRVLWDPCRGSGRTPRRGHPRGRPRRSASDRRRPRRRAPRARRGAASGSPRSALAGRDGSQEGGRRAWQAPPDRGSISSEPTRDASGPARSYTVTTAASPATGSRVLGRSGPFSRSGARRVGSAVGPLSQGDAPSLPTVLEVDGHDARAELAPRAVDAPPLPWSRQQ